MNAERLARIAALVKSGQIDLRKFADYTKLPGGEWGYINRVENGGSGSYGDFTGDHDTADFAELADDEDLYVFSRYTGYSDYSGSTVEAANCAELHEQFDGAAISVYGGYDTTDVCFSLRWICDDETDFEADTLLDIFEGLEDYPLINDEALSNIEMECADEAWDCWAYSDFVKGVEKALNVELDGHDKDSMRTVFEAVREDCNEYWEAEGGAGKSVYIRVERIVAVVTVAHVKQWIVPVVLAVRDEAGVLITTVTLTGDEWESELSLYDDVAEIAVDTYLDDCTDFVVGEHGPQYSVAVV